MNRGIIFGVVALALSSCFASEGYPMDRGAKQQTFMPLGRSANGSEWYVAMPPFGGQEHGGMRLTTLMSEDGQQVSAFFDCDGERIKFVNPYVAGIAAWLRPAGDTVAATELRAVCRSPTVIYAPLGSTR